MIHSSLREQWSNKRRNILMEQVLVMDQEWGICLYLSVPGWRTLHRGGCGLWPCGEDSGGRCLGHVPRYQALRSGSAGWGWPPAGEALPSGWPGHSGRPCGVEFHPTVQGGGQKIKKEKLFHILAIQLDTCKTRYTVVYNAQWEPKIYVSSYLGNVNLELASTYLDMDKNK